MNISFEFRQPFSMQLKQAKALTVINFKSFPQRFIASMVSILSIACVAAVILSILAMTQGMMKTLQRTGLDNTVLVMRAGASSELQSVMFPAEVNILANHHKIVKNILGEAQVSAEMFVNAEVTYAASTSSINDAQQKKSLALRGISDSTQQFRPNFQLVSGKMFATGVRQLIIGQAIARRIPEFTVGKMITLGGAEWMISGVFADGNSVFESELWADIGIVQSDYRRGNTVQSVRLALKNNTNISLLDKEWADDPRLNIRVISEKVFFADQAWKQEDLNSAKSYIDRILKLRSTHILALKMNLSIGIKNNDSEDALTKIQNVYQNQPEMVYRLLLVGSLFKLQKFKEIPPLLNNTDVPLGINTGNPNLDTRIYAKRHISVI
mgnify:CR=1 FL=1